MRDNNKPSRAQFLILCSCLLNVGFISKTNWNGFKFFTDIRCQVSYPEIVLCPCYGKKSSEWKVN